MTGPARIAWRDRWLRTGSNRATDPVPVAAGAAAVTVVAATALAFAAVTTFIGDDHLFLAFARDAPNPLAAFVRDQHGGEAYRPLPMLLWWVLARAGGGSELPFAVLSFALHAAVSLQVGALVAGLHPGDRTDADLRAGIVAGALFFLAPATQEAAFWYAASTDLLATAFGLATVIALTRGHTWAAVLWFAAACWSKESAVVLPFLSAIALAVTWPHRPRREIARRVAPLLPVLGAYLLARTVVLGGTGRFGDTPAPVAGKMIQIASGLAHAISGSVISHEGLAWSIGLSTWGVLLFAGAHRRTPSGQRDHRALLAPLGWLALSAAPLLAAPWIVGARYFYLPAVGIAWLAGRALARAGVVVVVGILAALSGLDLAQDLGRRTDVVSYRARLGAARRAVADGLDHGFHTFHIAAGLKDLDLAVKEDPRLAGHESDLLVLGDVPASFVVVSESRARELDFLLARPPSPPSGGYRFGQTRVVGLARRGDDPTLDEVIAHLPEIRFIRLRLGPGGRVISRDATETIRDETLETAMPEAPSGDRLPSE